MLHGCEWGLFLGCGAVAWALLTEKGIDLETPVLCGYVVAAAWLWTRYEEVGWSDTCRGARTALVGGGSFLDAIELLLAKSFNAIA